jgi:uncharacterized membrane protein YidH (DUF202 family)
VAAWPLWKWLRLLDVLLVAVGAAVLAIGVLRYECQIRRGRLRHYRGRSILGFALVELAAAMFLVSVVSGFHAPPRFTAMGLLTVGIGVAGFVLVLRAWHPSSSST